ncbi:hypothetical protein HYC85_025697 [Camellia sinensis]|uniref:EF-hand domain-containing protein n=1 Tax=Camellia sinensis TaxID=4442 RepID=A0A7J7GE45_CAMSI|nr:hypothetical protein HYC85_025697 [Camellia sinensis]
MSGYPQHNAPGYGYGPPPSQQPYSAAQYGGAQPPPGQQSYTSYGAPPAAPGQQSYGAPPSAPYADNKPPKDKPSGAGYPPQAAALWKPIRISDAIGLPTRLGSERVFLNCPLYTTNKVQYADIYFFWLNKCWRTGPKEFTAVFYSLQNWRAIFERFDRDRSGKIDSGELRDALLSLGFSVSPVVLELLVSKFDKTGGKNRAIEYDNFIECCLTVKGLTEKFKEKDTTYSGSATFNYESFMLTVLPFLIA